MVTDEQEIDEVSGARGGGSDLRGGLALSQPLRSACKGAGRSSGPSSCAREAGVIAVTSLAADTAPVVG
jgi:hypothetical protein